MEGGDAALIGIALALALALVEVIKVLVAKINPRNKQASGLCGILEADVTQIRIDSGKTKTGVDALVKAHGKSDEDGVPLWYVPRSWGESQKDIAEILREVANTQKRTIETLVRVEKSMVTKEQCLLYHQQTVGKG